MSAHLGCAVSLIAAISLAATTNSFADEPSPEDTPDSTAKAAASERFKRGVDLYQAGDVRAAVIEFKRAYEIAPTYHLLFNIGQASAELMDYVHAFNSFTRYLRDGGAKIGPQRRAMVRRELARLETYLAHVKLKISVDAAEVLVDGAVVGVSPLSGPLLVSAGRRKVTVSRAGYAVWERSVDLAGEDELFLDVTLHSLTAEPSAIKNDPSGNQPSRVGGAFWTSAAATLAFGLGTGVAAVLTVRAEDDYDEELARVPNTQLEIDNAADKVRRMALITDIGIGLTATAAVVTIVLAIRGGGDERGNVNAVADRVRVGFGPSSVAIGGTF